MDQRPRPVHPRAGFDDYPDARNAPRMSGPAVASFVLGIVALLTSLVPLVKNASFVIALLGAVLVVGATATLDSGLQVTVTGVGALTDGGGTPITAVRVSYVNAGGDQQAFAAYDWKTLTDGGVIEGSVIFLGDDPGGSLLDFGQLVAGGSVDGTVYLEGTVVAVQSYANAFVGVPTVAWVLA